jgi:hypothetical protein
VVGKEVIKSEVQRSCPGKQLDPNGIHLLLTRRFAATIVTDPIHGRICAIRPG